LSPSYKISKVIFDYLVGFVSLILLLPLLLVIFILIRLDSGAPSIYLGNRVGKNGLEFKIIKFRTMINRSEYIDGGNVTSENDPRITKIGKTLRKYKLDELPQLFNIIRGEMSFVGPRPEVQEFVDMYSEEDKKIILSVKPGITDLSSLSLVQLGKELGSSENKDVFNQNLNKVLNKKIKLRRKYVKKMSFSLDLKIIIKTLLKIII